MKTILFELNEVPFKVLETYLDRNENTAFHRLMLKAKVAETITPDANWLHPWCTWATLHRGVDTEKHMLTNLSQDLTEVDMEFPPIWKILASHEVDIGIGGSLNSWPMPNDISSYKFYLPDTFASDAQGFPDEVSKFQDFNLSMVDKSARNVSTGISGGKALGLIPHLLKLGFTFNTANKIINQLASERYNSSRKGRRRILQGVLAFDVFYKQLVTQKPTFTTFFTNHVASSMHRYWAAAYPEDFDRNDFAPDWIKAYSDEINYSMKQADEMIGKLLSFVDKNPDYNLILTTSMGQSANLGKSISKQIYVKNPDKFMGKLFLDSEDWTRRRVMLPRFAVVINESKAEIVRQRAQSIKVAGQKVKHEERAGNFHMFHFGMENVPEEDAYIEIGNQKFTLEDAGLENTTIEDQSSSSGYHMPTGIWISYNSNNTQSVKLNAQVDTREIVPSLLQRHEVDIPGYMKKPSISLF